MIIYMCGGVLKIQLFLFIASFHAVGLAGQFPPMRSAWQARGNDKACQANGMGN